MLLWLWQVYTWTLEPLTAASDAPSNSSKRDAASAVAAAGSSASDGAAEGAGGGGAAGAPPATAGGGILTAWELRLIMEYCGQVSLTPPMHDLLQLPRGHVHSMQQCGVDSLG